MLKSITILVALLFMYSVPSKAQNSNKNFYNKAQFTTLVTVDAVKNRVIEGNSIGVKGSFHLNPNNFGLFVGGEAFATKSGSSFTGDPRVESDNKVITTGFGLTLGILKNGIHIFNDSRINMGFSHISQSGSLLLPDLFGYLKFNQIQNDWICYVEGTSEINFNQIGFNRLMVGARFEIPSSTLAQASVNGQEIKIRAAMRRNFRAWVELGLFSLVINSWAVTPSVRTEYIHLTQNELNLFQPGVIISIRNQVSEVIRIHYSQEFDPEKNSRLLHRISVTLDVINLSQGL